MILLCISVSNIFENDVKSDTGLYLAMSHLSPFLYITTEQQTDISYWNCKFRPKVCM